MTQPAAQPSRVRQAAQWVASKPETTAWIAVTTGLILVLEFCDHVLHLS